MLRNRGRCERHEISEFARDAHVLLEQDAQNRHPRGVTQGAAEPRQLLLAFSIHHSRGSVGVRGATTLAGVAGCALDRNSHFV